MKWLGGKDSQADPRVASHDKNANNAPRIPSLANSQISSGLLHRELAIAREVQKASFPQPPPVIPGLTCAIYYKPAHSLGGDYYDFLSLMKGAWGIAIGDVSGKGIGAALVMASLQGSLRAQTWQPRSEPETLMANVNRLVWDSSPLHFFVSLFYAEYQPESRALKYVNAGHNPPIVLRRNNDQYVLVRLAPQCVPVGLIEDATFTSTTFQLEIDDVLIAYTDGITESENSDGKAFGDKRLERVLGEWCTQDPHEILQRILDEVFTHCAGYPPTDDITLLVMRVHA